MKKILLTAMACAAIASCNSKENKQTEATVQQPQQEEAQAVNNEEKVAAEGSLAPEFTLTAPDGKSISLSDFKGKHLVLDFWGTWCKWCVKGIPDMKEYYEKYSGQFEMLSIDIGDDEATWKRAIVNYGMKWKHGITYEAEAQALAKAYALEGFPTKMVIDPEGRIIKIIVGESPDFYKYLDDLFGKK